MNTQLAKELLNFVAKWAPNEKGKKEEMMYDLMVIVSDFLGEEKKC